MKEYTLEQTWEYCLVMWKYVAEEWQKGRRDISMLKNEWIREHDFSCITGDCFFCHYDVTHYEVFSRKALCEGCPGGEVSPFFDCYNSGWNADPPKFYRTLKRMYAKKKKMASLKGQVV